MLSIVLSIIIKSKCLLRLRHDIAEILLKVALNTIKQAYYVSMLSTYLYLYVKN